MNRPKKEWKSGAESASFGAVVMPDIASDIKMRETGPLDWVGMERIELPLRLMFQGREVNAPARVDAFVNLMNPEAKGIHMSRLYLHLAKELPQHELSPELLAKILKLFVDSHGGLSDRARLKLKFEWPAMRPALKSGYEGYRSYPIEIVATRQGDTVQFKVRIEILYSSTCPCSAALARQLIQEQFLRDYQAGQFTKQDTQAVALDEVMKWIGSERGIVATPHSQRSVAEMSFELRDGASHFLVEEMVNVAEGTLQTPVQTAVKREDEQEFARLNGSNLMFCEDAARKLARALNDQSDVIDYSVKCRHLESLHPHDAVSIVTKSTFTGQS